MDYDHIEITIPYEYDWDEDDDDNVSDGDNQITSDNLASTIAIKHTYVDTEIVTYNELVISGDEYDISDDDDDDSDLEICTWKWKSVYRRNIHPVSQKGKPVVSTAIKLTKNQKSVCDETVEENEENREKDTDGEITLKDKEEEIIQEMYFEQEIPFFTCDRVNDGEKEIEKVTELVNKNETSRGIINGEITARTGAVEEIVEEMELKEEIPFFTCGRVNDGEEEIKKETELVEENETSHEIINGEIIAGKGGAGEVVEEMELKGEIPSSHLSLPQTIEQTGWSDARNAIQNLQVIEECNSYDGSCPYYRKRHCSKHWTLQETFKFYHFLARIGADFSLMASLFPGRSRMCLKNKFKHEEKANPNLISKAMYSWFPKKNFKETDLEQDLIITNARVVKLCKRSMEEKSKTVIKRTKKTENNGTRKIYPKHPKHHVFQSFMMTLH